mmetsp:Transcript_23200/g.71086  ORF Transcript_23200/g.71086 Transcript_23200/m.71086 type:complete len:109 (-) Transcript_23200:313-639(-)
MCDVSPPRVPHAMSKRTWRMGRTRTLLIGLTRVRVADHEEAVVEGRHGAGGAELPPSHIGRKTLHARETSCKAQGAHPAAVHMVVYVYRINNNVACSPRSVAAVAFTH